MIEDLLEIISNISGIISSGIFDEKGLLICYFGDRETTNKIANTMQRIVNENHNQFYSLNLEPITCLTLIGDTGTSLFWPLNKSSSLAMMIDNDANLGKIRRNVENYLPRIKELI
tara:strand:+ start:1905 stop:2249 length:345 start_codon:yes stop_codon:yes gene_type:complete